MADGSIATTVHKDVNPLPRADWVGIGLTSVLILVIATIALTPVVFIIIGSLSDANPGEPWRFGFEGWREVMESARTLNAIGYSFLLNIRAVIGLGVAFLISWLLIRVRIPAYGFIEFSLWVAYFLPSLPLALSWILLLDPHYGLINQLLTHVGITLDIFSISGIIWIHLTLYRW